jgi:hypothetical protein
MEKFGGYYAADEKKRISTKEKEPVKSAYEYVPTKQPVVDQTRPPAYQSPKVESAASTPQIGVGSFTTNEVPPSRVEPVVHQADKGTMHTQSYADAAVVATPCVAEAGTQVVPQVVAAVKTEKELEEDRRIESIQKLEPFYHDSIARFCDMIEQEAAADTDEEKLKIFQDFMQQEYFIRGQRYPLALGAPPSRPISIISRPGTSGIQGDYVPFGAPLAQPPQEPAIMESTSHEPEYHRYQPIPQRPQESFQSQPTPGNLAHASTSYVQSPAQSQPIPGNLNHATTTYGGPGREHSPVSSVSSAPYKPFRASSAQIPAQDGYVPFSPSQTPMHIRPAATPSPKPAYVPFSPPKGATPSPKPTYVPYSPPQARPQSTLSSKPTYVPFSPALAATRPQATPSPKPVYAAYKPPAFGTATPRRNSYAGYDEPHGNAPAGAPGQYAPFRPGSGLGAARPMSTIEPGFGGPHRAHTTVEGMGMGILGITPLTFKKDETFLPVKEKAGDVFFPGMSGIDDDVSDVSDDEMEQALAAAAPVFTTPINVDGLREKLPPKDSKREKSPILEDLRTKLTAIGEDFSFIEEFNRKFQEAEEPRRKKLIEDRQKRKQAHADWLDDKAIEEEISFGEIAEEEEKFARTEEKLRQAEEMAEYNQYVKEVFEPVYNKLQEGIKEIMDLHFKTSGELLSLAVTARDRWTAEGRPELENVLQMLVRIDGIVERRHGRVHEAIQARDRQYRLTVIEPLRARADATQKIKSMMKYFDDSEKKLYVTSFQLITQSY